MYKTKEVFVWPLGHMKTSLVYSFFQQRDGDVLYGIKQTAYVVYSLGYMDGEVATPFLKAGCK